MVMRCPGCNTMVVPSMTSCPVCATAIGAASPDSDQQWPTEQSGSWTPPNPKTAPAPTPRAPAPHVPTKPVAAAAVNPPYAPSTPAVTASPASAPIPTPAAAGVQVQPGTPAVASDTGDPGSGGGGHRGILIGVGSFVVVLALLAGTFLVINGHNGKAVTVTLEALDAHPAGSFTASVVKLPTNQAKQFAAKSRKESGTSSTKLTTKATRGDAHGLYGVAPGHQIGDIHRLGELVRNNTAKAAAWATAMDTDTSHIDTTLQSLTPVVLGSDTAATDHTFVSGKTVEQQVVLQAGTAVLVDANAAPRVRLGSGDPLSSPELPSGDPSITGTQWAGFDPGSVVEVQPTAQAVDSVTAVDISTGKQVATPLGGTISLDGYLVADNTGVSVVSTDGKTRTQVIDHTVATVFDDGAGGLVYQESNPGTDRPVTDTSRIMRLAAGATDPVPLATTPTGRKIQLWDVGIYHGTMTALFTESTAPKRDAEISTFTSIHLVNLETGKDDTTNLTASADNPAAYEANVYGGGLADESFALEWGSSDPGWYQFKTPDQPSVMNGLLCYATNDDECVGGTGGLLPGGQLATSSINEAKDVVINVYDEGSRTFTRQVRLDQFDIGDENAWDTDISVSDGKMIVSLTEDGGRVPQPAVAIDMKSWQTTTLPVSGDVSLLHAPVVRPHREGSDAPSGASSTSGPTPTSQPTTTTAPVLSAPTWDEFKNASLPAVCAHPATTLVDGKNVSLRNSSGADGSPPQGIYELEETLGDVAGGGANPGYVAGLPSDAGPLTAVVVSCNAGGVAWPNDIVAFKPGGIYYDETSLNGHVTGDSFDTANFVDEAGSLWTQSGLAEPGRGGVWKLAVEGDKLVVYTMALRPGEAECCATGYAKVTMNASGGKLNIDSVEVDSGP